MFSGLFTLRVERADFSGATMAQALMAASMTVLKDRSAHSSRYFMRPERQTPA